MATDRIKAKLEQLRGEADVAIVRAEEAEEKVKKLEQLLLEKEQEVKSLEVRLGRTEAELEKADGQLTLAKEGSLAGEASKTTAEGLLKKIAVLEEELDKAEVNLKETNEKLRQVDVKAEHFERQVIRAEGERDAWEKKHEELVEKYKKSQAELIELEASLNGL